MWEDLNAFFRKAAEEDQETPSGEEDLLDEKENVSDDPDSEDLQDLGFSGTEVDPETADSSFFFNPQKAEQGLSSDQTETVEYKVDDREEKINKQLIGTQILLDAHRVDWVIRSAYQSLFLYLRDAVKDAKSKELTYRIKFVETPWTEGTLSIDTLSRFNVYYDTFSEAIQKLEPKIEKVQWSPTFQGKDLFLTFEVSIK